MIVQLILAAAMTAAPAPSDPVGIYGVIDKVVLEGDAAKPTAIQVWGTFSVSDQKAGDNYQPAVKGYLYFKLDGKDDVARAEWNDLKSVAGTKQMVGFAVKWQREKPGRVRCATEKPSNPDPYSIGIGLIKMGGDRNSGWPVARDLLKGTAPAAACAK